MDARTVKAYELDARSLSARYESADMSRTHRVLLRHLPKGGRILEVGCGSGRDAAFLLAQGFNITAIDASGGMIRAARAAHPDLAGRLRMAAFPLKARDPLLQQRFDAIAAIAVLMHLSDADLKAAAGQAAQLLDRSKILFISASTGRAGIRGRRDVAGRLYVERSPADLLAVFKPAGFRRIALHRNADAFDRRIRWFSMVLIRTGE
jgi:SAM-dependent methyltransferase